MNRCRSVSKLGFTLVEIAISIAIASLIALGIFIILNSGSSSWNQETTLLELQQQTRSAIEGMTKEIRQIDPLQNVDIINDGHGIVFHILDVSNSISYYLNGNGQIIREHPPGSTRAVAGNISSINFSHTGNIVEIFIVATKVDKRGRSLTFSLTGRVKLRNE